MTRVLTGGTYLDRHPAEAAKAVPGEADTAAEGPQTDPSKGRQGSQTGAFGKRFLKSSHSRRSYDLSNGISCARVVHLT